MSKTKLETMIDEMVERDLTVAIEAHRVAIEPKIRAHYEGLFNARAEAVDLSYLTPTTIPEKKARKPRGTDSNTPPSVKPEHCIVAGCNSPAGPKTSYHCKDHTTPDADKMRADYRAWKIAHPANTNAKPATTENNKPAKTSATA